MTKEKEKNSPEKIDAVKVWTAITGLDKEIGFVNDNVKLTNENVKTLSINFSTLEQKIIQLNLNFKGMESITEKVKELNGGFENLEKNKIDKKVFVTCAVILGVIITALELIGFFLKK